MLIGLRQLNDKGLPTFYGESESDETGKKVINSQEEAYAAAFVYAGRREPTFAGGFSTDLRYKRFSLNALFSFALGNNVRLTTSICRPDKHCLSLNRICRANLWIVGARKEMRIIRIFRLCPMTIWLTTYERKYPIANNRWDMYNKSDLRVVSGDFLRCRS